MKNSISFTQISSAISHFFKRFHVIIFTLTVVIGVSIAIFMLNSLAYQQATDEPSSSAQVPVFDQETIDRINSFNTADTQESTFSLPPGRINPLVD